MRSFLLGLLFLSSWSSPLAFSAVETSCIEKHIRDAIEINQERLKLYKKESTEAGKLFKKLIRLEKLMLLPSIYLDARAKPYNKKGHRLFCDDLVSMDSLPPFSGTRDELNRDFTVLPEGSIKTMKTKLKDALDSGPEAFQHALGLELTKLDRQPREYHCLIRHFLESMARTASLWPRYRNEAGSMNLTTPDKLIGSYLKNHILALGFMARLDARAGLIQKSGLAIFCQDVPAIPTGAETFSSQKTEHP